jgi:hypothetical protein
MVCTLLMSMAALGRDRRRPLAPIGRRMRTREAVAQRGAALF